MVIKNFIKKIIHLKGHEEANLESIELWEVRWMRRYGKYVDDKEPMLEVFTNFEDAKTFYDRLKEAKELLKYTENIGLTIKKKD